LLWTALLSLFFFAFGVNDVIPLILNIAFATALCVWVYGILRKKELPNYFVFLSVFLIAFCTPFHSLIFCGQEHILHTLIAIAFVYLAAKILSKEATAIGQLAPLLMLALVVTTVRYEGLFLVFTVGLLFIVKRKPRQGLAIWGTGFLPAVVYGIVSVSKGWFFLPNPVLIKGNLPHFTSLVEIIRFLTYFAYQLKKNTTILMLVLGNLISLYLLLRKKKSFWDEAAIMLAIFLGITFLHLQFAVIGAFARHEAYLVVLGLFVLSFAAKEFWPEKIHIEKKMSSKTPFWRGFYSLLCRRQFCAERRFWLKRRRQPRTFMSSSIRSGDF